MRYSILVLVSLLALMGGLWPGIAAAQVADATLIDQVDVRLVVVDVWVEQGGTAVSDLDASAFSVFEDGQPVEIAQFSALARESAGDDRTWIDSDERPLLAEGMELPADGRARLVVYVDELHMGKGHRGQLFKQLRKTIDEIVRPGDEVAIATFDGQIRMRLPFTADPKEISRALSEEARRKVYPATAALASPEFVLRQIDQQARDAALNTTQNIRAQGMEDPCEDLAATAAMHSQQAESQALASIAGMRRFVQSLARYDGRKSLLLVSDGIPLLPGQEVQLHVAELCFGQDTTGQDRLTSDQRPFDPRKPLDALHSQSTRRSWDQLGAQANAQSVTIYPFQVAGLRANRSSGVDSARTAMTTESAGMRNLQDGLYTLANDTGGKALFNTNQPSDVLALAVEDASAGYRLAYTPPRPADGEVHTIRVEVEGPGDVRYRRSYVAETREEKLSQAVFGTFIHGSLQNPLGAKLEVVDVRDTPTSGDGGDGPRSRTARLRVVVPLDHLALVPQEGHDAGSFAVFIGARDGWERYTPVGHKSIPVGLPSGKSPRGESYTYEVEIPLRGVEATVVVAVHDELGGETSFLEQKVVLVPAGSDSGP